MTPTLRLYRIAMTGQETFGAAVWNGVPFAVTLEDPWRDNHQDESCIPAGEYLCLRCSASPNYGYRDSPKFGDTFQVFNVPGRSLILFHWGNRHRDTEGCILLGESYEPLGGQNAIQSSVKAFTEFKQLTKGLDEFRLVIEDVWRGQSDAQTV